MKQNRFTRLLLMSILGAIFVIYLTFDVSAAIVDRGTCGDNLWWTYSDEHILTIGGKGEMKDYTSKGPWSAHIADTTTPIYEIIIGEGVTSIGENAFYACDRIFNLTIPKTVTKIGSGAFKTCVNMREIEICGNISEIDSSIFLYCNDLKIIKFYGKAPESFPTDLSESLTIYYGPEATGFTTPTWNGYACYPVTEDETEFENNNYLDATNRNKQGIVFTLNTNSKTATVGNLTEYQNNSLYVGSEENGEIIIPDYVIKNEISYRVIAIGQNAFSGNSTLTSVQIPSTIMSIGKGAFSKCEYITEFVVSADNKVFSSDENGILYNKNKTQIIQYPAKCKLEDFSIPATVTSISKGAFSGATNLKHLTLSFVGGSKNSSSETEATLFGYIFGESLYFGGKSTVQKYGDTTVTFYIPSSLESVTITGGNFYGSVFMNCTSLKKVVLPQNMKKISCDFFSGCTSLEEVNIPESVTVIEENVFSGCSNLKEIIIPMYVTAIMEGAFRNCTNLENLAIPESVVSIGEGAFYGCSSLTELTIPFIGAHKGGSGEYDDVFGYIFGTNSEQSGVKQYFSESSYKWYNIPSTLRKVHLLDGTVIPYGAFYNCGTIRELSIPKSTTIIKSDAFYNTSIRCLNIKDLESYLNIKYDSDTSHPMIGYIWGGRRFI